ncbi:hypothetical protein BDR22DRAFT_894763 [Usnea florida]
MKTLSFTIPLLQFFLINKSQFAYARGKFALYETCQAQNKASFMRDEMALVMESAASTKAALPNPNADTNRFVRWMFGTSSATYDPYAAPRAIIGGTGTGEDDIIGLAGLTGEVPVDTAAGGDVIVFCGMGHIQAVQNDQGEVLEWYDTFDDSYSDPDPSTLACNNTRSGYRGNAKIPAAFTYWKQVVGGGAPNVPDQIVICQWYLDAALASAYRDTGDFDDNFLNKASRFWQYQQPPTGPAIDSFYLFDSTLAHEILHTWIGDNRQDVAGLNSYGGLEELSNLIHEFEPGHWRTA